MDTLQRTIRIQADAVLSLLTTIEEDVFMAAVNILKTSTIIFTLGVGKSSYIAAKIADTFTSVGSPAIFLRTEQVLHGSLHLIQQQKNACVLLISKSGETQDLIDILEYLRYNENIQSIVITSNKNSTMAHLAKITILYSGQECCGTNFVPTTSTTLSLIIGDALAMTLMKEKKWTIENFAETHPGGNLGTLVRDSIGTIEFPS